MRQDEAYLHLLMGLPAHFYLNLIVLLELLQDLALRIAEANLNPVLVQISCRALPPHLLDQIVCRKEDSRTSQTQLYDETLSPYLRLLGIEKQVNEAFNHALF